MTEKPAVPSRPRRTRATPHASASPPAPAPRRRREPEQARREILDATERLVAERGPDAVGLKDVAREAGVSHGLVTHYFGTYEALVEAALERRVNATRDAVLARLAAAGPVPEPGDLLKVAFALANDPVQVRLAVWAMLTGRSQRVDFFATRQKGMRRVADAVAAALAREGAATDEESRREVDFVVLLAICASYGYALGKPAFLPGLGRRPSAAEDADFAERLAAALRILIEPRRSHRAPTR